MDVKPGGVIADKFSIERRLGGDKGRDVVLAKHLQSGRLVAIEVMASGTSERRTAMRFARAAQIASQHVPAFMDIGALADGRPYVVIEYLDGMSLQRSLAGKPVPIAEAVDTILQACDAVAGAHAVGLLHRKLTPSSLFRTMRDGAPCIKVLHFTDTPLRAPEEGRPGEAPEVSEYTAPEIFDNSAVVDRRCDVWSLGVMLYELLTGTRPFTARNPAKLAKRVREDSPTPPRALRRDIPEALERAVLMCLEKSVTSRWHSVADFAQALAPFGTALTRDIPIRLAKSGASPHTEAVTQRAAATTVPVRALEDRIDSLGISDRSRAPGGSGLDGGSDEPASTSDVGFRKMLSDGRIQSLDADSVVGVVRAQRVASDARSLAKGGPRVSAPQEEEAEMKAIALTTPASRPPEASAPPAKEETPAEDKMPSIPVVDSTDEARRKTLAVLILLMAVISGLLVGLVVKMLRGR